MNSEKSKLRLRIYQALPPPVVLGCIAVFLLMATGSYLTTNARFESNSALASGTSIADIYITMVSGFLYTRDIPFSEAIRWMAVCSPPILITGLFLSMEFRSVLYFVLMRKQSVVRWWLECYATVCVAMLLYALLGLLVSVAVGAIYGVGLFSEFGDASMLMLAWALFALHILSVAALQSVLALVVRDAKFVSLFLLSLPVVTMLMGVISEGLSLWFPGSWGMAMRSIQGRQYFINSFGAELTGLGFDPAWSMGIEICLIVLLFFVGARALIRKGLPSAWEV